jgi:hypothetical protein
LIEKTGSDSLKIGKNGKNGVRSLEKRYISPRFDTTRSDSLGRRRCLGKTTRQDSVKNGTSSEPFSRNLTPLTPKESDPVDPVDPVDAVDAVDEGI